jgi:hypothetical protein
LLPSKFFSTNTISIDVWRLEHSNETLIIDFGNREMGTTFELELFLTTTFFHFVTNLKHVFIKVLLSMFGPFSQALMQEFQTFYAHGPPTFTSTF